MSARRLTAHPGARRGAVLPLVCILLVALLGGAALAIDLGRLYHVGAELQTAADAAALAAITASQRDPDHDSQQAVARAAAVGALNRAAGAAVQIQAADVLPRSYDPSDGSVYTNSWTGTVNAVRVYARARPSYLLAGALGLSPPSMSRTAVAWLASVNGAACVRPFALPYTRNFEYGMTRPNGSKMFTDNWTNGSGGSPYAPEYTQPSIASLQRTSTYGSNPPTSRTYVQNPPWTNEDQLRASGLPVMGAWKPVDFTGAGSFADFQTFAAAPTTGSTCQAAKAQVGDTKPALAYTPGGTTQTTLRTNLSNAMVTLCNQLGSNPTDDRCLDTRGRQGVPTRVAFSDSVLSGGTYVHRVREVSQVRIVCYFRSTGGICPPNPALVDGYGLTSSWQMPAPPGGGSPVNSGYPAGTIVVVLDGPASMNMTTDVVLGTKPGITQRLILVK